MAMAIEYTVKECPKADSGMLIPGAAPVNVLDGGSIKQLSFNPFDGGTFLSTGDSHGKGGMKVDSTGDGTPDAEIEGGESIHTSPVTGDKYVGGNLFIPGTKTKFKKAFKKIGEFENKAEKMASKSSSLLGEKDPEDPFQVLGYNAGNVMQWSATRQQQALAREKEELAQVQEAIHGLAKVVGVEPKEINKGMKFGGKLGASEYKVKGVPAFKEGGNLPIARDGYKTNNEPLFNALGKYPSRFKYVDWAKEAAEAEGIDPGVFQRLLFRESGFNPTPKPSYAGAKGIAQFMPDTYAGLGYKKSDLDSSSEQAIKNQLRASAIYFRQGMSNGDPRLAAIRYNGGQKAIDFVKGETGNKNITGQEWIDFMTDRRQKHPTSDKSAWQNQTYNYVKALDPQYLSNADFYAGKKVGDIPTNEEFQTDYTTPLPQRTPDVLPQLLPVGFDTPQQMQTPALKNMSADQQAELQYARNQASYHAPVRPPSLADSNKLGIGQFLPEIAALGDRPDFVPHQQLNPTLFQPYSVSFQDRLNQNNSSFRGIQQNLVNNPEALSVLAAQKYAADNQVMAEQFRTNQGIDNQITNQNINIINQTREKNLALNDQQYVRQAQAKENTRANKRGAINSIITKIGQNRLENNNIRMMENMYNYRFNPTSGNMDYIGPNAVFDYSGMGGGNSYGTDPNSRTVYERDAEGNLVPTRVIVDGNKTARRKKWGGKMR